ncbi:hypothetical protein LG634_18520 [Streptomyces bambusae]|uniref:hypothetical protein n=1 Tax=Streptomyces bambusae TaxID=1550616 RepID=UPI001CFD7EB3|nr:hypothetical protein [Streptomyces bambusae]MCB5166829.1 hypothetical protein [Streptomyces bambusae]
MAQRETALRLDEQWARIRSGAAYAEPAEQARLLDELITALRRAAGQAPGADPECAARLGLRLGDLAARRFAGGDRPGALAAIEEALAHARQAAPHSPEYARWYARGLINHGVWLAWPLSDGRRLPRYPLGPSGEEGPDPMERAAGERARDQTRAAVEVWLGLDGTDPVNRRGLAQATVFLADRLAELGFAHDAVAWAVAAENDFRELLATPAAEGSDGSDEAAETAEEAGEALAHLARQLELRLRYLSFDSLARLRADGLLPGRLLPQAAVAARIQGVPAAEIAARLHLDADTVAEFLRTRPWRAVWRVDVREPGGLWAVQGHPWHSAAEVADRTAQDVGAELVREFGASADHPGPAAHWRIHVWWHEEGDPAGSRFRLMYAPGSGTDPTPS